MYMYVYIIHLYTNVRTGKQFFCVLCVHVCMLAVPGQSLICVSVSINPLGTVSIYICTDLICKTAKQLLRQEMYMNSHLVIVLL